ncbi:MAG: GTP-binding protein [Bacilli bacterium]|nr:GTP-binding protein [Bacilli bacterium]
MKPIPITLVTGYLGSGKTTLINHVLRNASGYKVAVIVNDIGEVNIDADLIAAGGVVSSQDQSLVALQNGCICCTLREDLLDQVAGLVDSGKFDHILIEASGVCEPLPIAETLSYYPNLCKEKGEPMPYYVDAVITVADGLRLKEEFAYGRYLTEKTEDGRGIESLIYEQLEFCDIVLLNKAETLSKEELAVVTKAIRAIQTRAEIIPVSYCDIPLEKIMDVHVFDLEATYASPGWSEELEHIKPENEEEHHHHHHDEDDDEDEYGIETFSYFRRPALDKDAFVEWAQTNNHTIFRSKGLVYFSKTPKEVSVYETAGSQISISPLGRWFSSDHTKQEMMERAEEDPVYAKVYDPTYLDRFCKIVFIGRNLDKDAITKELDALP